MALEIFARIEQDGEKQKVRIKGFKALPLSKLPVEYVASGNGDPAVWTTEEGTSLKLHNFKCEDGLTYSYFIWTNYTMSKERFSRFVSHCKKAGDRLHEINKKKMAEAKSRDVHVTI